MNQRTVKSITRTFLIISSYYWLRYFADFLEISDVKS